MASGSKAEQTEILEQGDVFFLYRPKVEHTEVRSVDDVQRFYMVLRPAGRRLYRLLVIGAKHLAEIEDGGARTWGFVETVAHRPEELEQELRGETYHTKTRGERHVPPARPVGEGVYALVAKGRPDRQRHTHLAYVLELPERPGEAQAQLNIRAEGTFIITIKNPEAGQPPQAGLGEAQKATFPPELQDRFHGRRFAPCLPPDFLDHGGAEFVLIGAGAEIGPELGITLPAEKEELDTAEILNDLRLARSRHPVEPLIKGEWR